MKILNLFEQKIVVFIENFQKMYRKTSKLEQNFKNFLNRNLNIFCLVYLLIFSLVLVLSSICYCSKIIFFSEYFSNSESDFVHFRSLFLQESRNHSKIGFLPGLERKNYNSDVKAHFMKSYLGPLGAVSMRSGP